MVPNSAALSATVVPLRDPAGVNLRAHLRQGVKPSDLQRMLEERVSTPTRTVPTSRSRRSMPTARSCGSPRRRSSTPTVEGSPTRCSPSSATSPRTLLRESLPGAAGGPAAPFPESSRPNPAPGRASDRAATPAGRSDTVLRNRMEEDRVRGAGRLRGSIGVLVGLHRHGRRAGRDRRGRAGCPLAATLAGSVKKALRLGKRANKKGDQGSSRSRTAPRRPPCDRARPVPAGAARVSAASSGTAGCKRMRTARNGVGPDRRAPRLRWSHRRHRSGRERSTSGR